jgi:NDP-sugar pyrophosphorylase family protein
LRNKLGLDTVFKNNDSYDQSNIVIKDNLVAKYSKTEKTKDMVYIDYGAALFRKEALQLIPENCFSSIEELFLRLIDRKQLLAFEVTERFYEIGSPQGLKDFEEFARHRLGK